MNCGVANGRPAGIGGMEGMQSRNDSFHLSVLLVDFSESTQWSLQVVDNDNLQVLVIALEVSKQDVSSDVCLQVKKIGTQMQPATQAYTNFLSCPLSTRAEECILQLELHHWLDIECIVASLVIFLANIIIPCLAAFHKAGEVADILHLGAVTYTSIIWTVNCQIALVISHFSWTQRLVIWCNIFVSLLLYFLHIAIQRMLYPMDEHVVQEMKYCKKDVRANQMWLREQHNSQKMTQIGFSARVDARIRSAKEQLHQSRSSMQRSVTNSPIKSLET
ncbi:hypothetical protein WN943_012058 [Citrus x changshan-huyou]